MAFIHINKQNFYHNLNQIALKTGSIEKIAIVLKDNAYGHGLDIMAKLASEFGVKHAVVRTRKEAESIVTLFESILVLGDTITKERTISFAINNMEAIAKAQKGAKVELKVDTGMHRNGIALDEVEEALERIRERGLDLVGVMTHYRSADLLSSEFFWQKKHFDSVKERVKEAGFKNVRTHSYNSAAILRTQNFNEDLARVGIGAYGYNELPEVFDGIVFKPVMKLYANKVTSRVLSQGERIGYGGDFRASKQMRVSTYDLGYGDGWFRANSKTPYMTPEGLVILGRVSMDFISLESDQEVVCVMDDAQDAAKHFDTISYEVITALSKEIERRVI